MANNKTSSPEPPKEKLPYHQRSKKRDLGEVEDAQCADEALEADSEDRAEAVQYSKANLPYPR